MKAAQLETLLHEAARAPLRTPSRLPRHGIGAAAAAVNSRREWKRIRRVTRGGRAEVPAP
eukprot:354908-Chlamydomonas_euryale.AAC.3